MSINEATNSIQNIEGVAIELKDSVRVALVNVTGTINNIIDQFITSGSIAINLDNFDGVASNLISNIDNVANDTSKAIRIG